MENFNQKYLAKSYPLVSPYDFYRDIFPSGVLQKKGDYTQGKYNAIAIQVLPEKRSKRFTITDDLELIEELTASDLFTIISPVSYVGKHNRLANARDLHAIAFDLDGLIIKDGKPNGLINLIHQFTVAEFHPIPTYIVSSGTGIHLYYVLEKPLQLFPNVVKQVREYRSYFVKRVWNEYVTTLNRNPQFESVTQGFRAVGSICKDGKQRTQAYRVGEKVSIEYLNSFVVDDAAKITDYTYKSNLSLADAKEKYPQWYETRIEQNQPKGTWIVKSDLYYWWIRKIESGATLGHRYYCLMCLAIYARKCGIDYSELEKDAFRLMPFLDSKSPVDGSNAFTESDVIKALEAYDASYITFPRDSISELTAIPIQANKRNYRKQSVHLTIARATKTGLKVTGEMKDEGRPAKKKLILDYIKLHPDKSVSEIAYDLNVSRTTVYKWVKWANENQPSEGERWTI